METLIVTIPPELSARLAAEVGATPDGKDLLVREALEKLLDERAGVARSPKASNGLDAQPFPDGKSAYDMMKDVCGIFEGPGDLSTNPKYMEGFGEE